MFVFKATVSEDGKKQIHAQVITRAIGSNNTAVADNDARFIAHVVQVRFCWFNWFCHKKIIVGSIYQSTRSKYIGFGVHKEYSSKTFKERMYIYLCVKLKIYDPEGTTNLHIHMLDKTPPGRIGN